MKIKTETLFLEGLEWLENNYDRDTYFKERDWVWLLQKWLLKEIRKRRLPYVLNHDCNYYGKLPDLGIYSDDKPLLLVEFKYEPAREREDIPLTKKPLNMWKNIIEDIKKVQEYVKKGSPCSIFVFIDEGSRFRQKEAPEGCEWRDWRSKKHNSSLLISIIKK